MNDNQKAAVIVLTLLGISGVVIYEGNTGYDVGVSPCDVICYNSSDCTDALNNASVDYVCLGANISDYAGTFITWPSDNKIFDCQGHTIDGDDSGYDHGVYLNGRTDNTIKNCIISQFYSGFEIRSSSRNTFINNTLDDNSYYGISLSVSSSSNNLTNNIVSNSYYGIHLDGSSNNTITNNTANNNQVDGIRLGSSDSNQLINNNASNISGNGIYLSYSSSNILTNNTANNNEFNGIGLDHSDYNTLTYNDANSNRIGFWFDSSSNNNILNNNQACSNTDYDIYNFESNTGDNNECNTTFQWNDIGTTGCTYYCSEVISCTCANCTDCEEKLNSPLCNSVTLTADILNHSGSCINNPSDFNDKIFNCGGYKIEGDSTGYDYGIFLDSKTGNTINDCIISNFSVGILTVNTNDSIYYNNSFFNNSYGIHFSVSSGNNLTLNNATSNTYTGIYIYSSSNSNVLVNNYAERNSNGIYVHDSNLNNASDSIVYNNSNLGIYLNSADNNNFINNTAYLNPEGVRTYLSSYNNFTNNNLTANTKYGAYVWYYSTNNLFTGNNITANGYDGIFVDYYSTGNNFTDNNISLNERTGINFSVDSSGILNSNEVCYNNQSGASYVDISNFDSVTGDDNICDFNYNYNDTEYIGCSQYCDGSAGSQSTVCTCTDCTSCINALNNASCTTIKLTQNIINQSGTCINDPVNFNSKTFDCQGFTIDGDDVDDDRGIQITDKTGNTIKNCIISDFGNGIFLYHLSTFNNMINNTLVSNVGNGIYVYALFYSSNNNSIINNTFGNNGGDGIFLSGSNYNQIYNNNINNSGERGIAFSNADFNIVINNSVRNSGWEAFYISSLSENYEITDNIFCSSNLTGGGTYGGYDIYKEGNANFGDNNTCDTTYDWNDTDTIGCTYWCDNTTAKCRTCDECEAFLEIFNTVDLIYNISSAGTCIDNPAFNNSVFDCNGNTITGFNKTGEGINMLLKNNVTIRNCNFVNFSIGINIENSTEINLFNDSINESTNGIKVTDSSSNISIVDCTVVSNDEGIYLENTTSNCEVNTTRMCSNILDLWFYGNNTQIDNTCEVTIPENTTCAFACPGLRLQKTVNYPLIYEATNVTYMFNISNTGSCVISNLSLSDSEIGNVPLVVNGTNTTQTVVYPGYWFLVNYTVEISGTTINNATVTGYDTCTENWINVTDSARVEFFSGIINVSKTINQTIIRREDMNGNNTVKVNITVCGLTDTAEFDQDLDVVFLIDNSGFMGTNGAYAKEKIKNFMDDFMISSNDNVGVVTTKYGTTYYAPTVYGSVTSYNLNNSNDFADAKNFIDGITFSGWAYDKPGWFMAMDMFDNYGRVNAKKIVIYITSESGYMGDTFGSESVLRNVTIYTLHKRIDGTYHDRINQYTLQTGGQIHYTPNINTSGSNAFDLIESHIKTTLITDSINLFEVTGDYINIDTDSITVDIKGIKHSSNEIVYSYVNNTLSIEDIGDGNLTLGECSIISYIATADICGENKPIETSDARVVYYNKFDRYIGELDIQIEYINVTCPLPGISLTKTPSKTCAWNGVEIQYAYSINNTGNVDVNLSCTDNVTGTFTDDLDEGETTTKYMYATINATTNNSVNCTVCFYDGTCNSTKTSAIVYLANLSINKTADKSSYNSSENVTFTLNVTNNGDCDLANIYVYDMINNQSWTNYTIPSLNIGVKNTSTIEYDINYDDVIRGFVSNRMYTIAYNNDVSMFAFQNKTRNTIWLNVSVIPSPSVSIVKTVDNDEVYAGEIVRYNFTVVNTGDVALTSCRLYDEELYWIYSYNNTKKYNSYVSPYYQFDLPLSSNVTFYGDRGIVSTIENNASVTCNFKNYSATDSSLEEVRVCLVNVTKSVNDTSITPGQQVTFTITACNIGDCNMTNLTAYDYWKSDRLTWKVNLTTSECKSTSFNWTY